MFNYDKKKFEKNKKLIFSIVAVIFGFILAYVLNFKSKKKQALMLIWDEKCFHIHHWITYSFIIVIILLTKYYSISIDYLVVFFLLGLVLEDFLYRDIFQIREKCSKMCKFINKR